jgi:hypothetical protein
MLMILIIHKTKLQRRTLIFEEFRAYYCKKPPSASNGDGNQSQLSFFRLVNVSLVSLLSTELIEADITNDNKKNILAVYHCRVTELNHCHNPTSC